LPTLNGTRRASALWLPLRAWFPMIATRLRRCEQSDGFVDASADPLPKPLAMPQQMKRPGRR
jgi:hypothetical protein